MKNGKLFCLSMAIFLALSLMMYGNFMVPVSAATYPSTPTAEDNTEVSTTSTTYVTVKSLTVNKQGHQWLKTVYELRSSSRRLTAYIQVVSRSNPSISCSDNTKSTSYIRCQHELNIGSLPDGPQIFDLQIKASSGATAYNRELKLYLEDLTPPELKNQGFVTTSHAQFVLNGKTFYFAGSNCYWLMNFASQDEGIYPWYTSGNTYREAVREVFNDAVAMNETVIRTWAFNDDPDDAFCLQSSPGVYNEKTLKGLDYVLYYANTKGIRLILPLVNNWNDYGGMNQYCIWAGYSTKAHDQFYTDPTIKQWYKNYVSMILNRVNTYTGIAYKNDPTVFAWELANEPECKSDTSVGWQVLMNWTMEMSSYIKSIDSNHMVSTGSEGHYGTLSGEEPGNSYFYRGATGYDYTLLDLMISTIDYGSYHLYPDAWSFDLPTSCNWIKIHIEDAKNAGKPAILGEFGKKASRDTYFSAFYNEVLTRDGAGLLYWVAADDYYPDYDGFTVRYPADASTCQIIINGAIALKAKCGQTPVGPPAKKSPRTNLPIDAHANSGSDGKQPARNAIDNNNATYWETYGKGNDWIIVNLGLVYNINRVVLIWLHGYSDITTYKIEAWINNAWVLVYSTTTSQGGTEIIDFTAKTTQYVRLFYPSGRPRLAEFRVYEWT